MEPDLLTDMYRRENPQLWYRVIMPSKEPALSREAELALFACLSLIAIPPDIDEQTINLALKSGVRLNLKDRLVQELVARLFSPFPSELKVVLRRVEDVCRIIECMPLSHPRMH